jgi:hypothetical protein
MPLGVGIMERSIKLILIITLIISGCTTSQDAINIIAPKYIGQKADMFFSVNGPPYGQYVMDNGAKIYKWDSGVQNVSMPTTTSFDAYTTPIGMSGTATTSGGSITVDCQLEIHTDPKNTIQSFRVLRDTIGMWETSRCHEFFK